MTKITKMSIPVLAAPTQPSATSALQNKTTATAKTVLERLHNGAVGFVNSAKANPGKTVALAAGAVLAGYGIHNHATITAAVFGEAETIPDAHRDLLNIPPTLTYLAAMAGLGLVAKGAGPVLEEFYDHYPKGTVIGLKAGLGAAVLGALGLGYSYFRAEAAKA